MSADAKTADSSPDDAAASTPLSDVPGLGIIRIRMLNKRGWKDVESLRAASLEDIQAVPGLSAAKAKQIYDFLHGAEPQEAETPSIKPSVETDARVPEANATFAEALREVTTVLGVLERAPHAAKREPALAKQIARWKAFVEARQAGEALPVKDLADTLSRLSDLRAALAEAAARDSLSAKRQDRLAETLRETRRRMEGRKGK